MYFLTAYRVNPYALHSRRCFIATVRHNDAPWLVPVVTNGPIDRDVVFTVGNGVLGFDRTVGTLGALVSMPSSADGGAVEPPSSYPGSCNFDFQIESLLLQDQSGGNTAHR